MRLQKSSLRSYLIILLVSLSTLYTPLSHAAVESNPVVAKLSLVKNTVEVKYKNNNWHVVQSGELLSVGDQIRTKQGGLAEVTFINTGSKVRLSELTSLTIDNQSNDVTLSLGKIFIAVVKGKGGMKVRTSVAVASVLGTVGILEYDQGNNIYDITDIDGTFQITDNNNNTSKLTVGKSIRVNNAGINEPVTLSSDNIINLLKSNPYGLEPSFVKTGLAPENITTDNAGNDVIILDTANPNEKININLQTGNIQVIMVNTTGAVQPSPPVFPVIANINNIVSVVAADTVIRTLNPLVPVTVF